MIIKKTIIEKLEIVSEFRHLRAYTVTRFMDLNTNIVEATGSVEFNECLCGDEVGAEALGILDIANDLWTTNIRSNYKDHIDAILAAEKAAADALKQS